MMSAVGANKADGALNHGKAVVMYTAMIGDHIADIGSRGEKGKLNLVMTMFNVRPENYAAVGLLNRKLVRIGSQGLGLAHAGTQMGEHFLAGTLTLQELLGMEVFDSAGNSLGNLWENLEVEEEIDAAGNATGRPTTGHFGIKLNTAAKSIKIGDSEFSMNDVTE